ncbi:MAG: hypothetical protein ACTHN4_10170 [Sphingomicrobium sp.]
MKRNLRESLDWNGWPVAALALFAFAYVAFNQAIFNDGDVYWHIGAGRWMLGHFSVPVTDPFSFTARGHAWTSHEWLSEMLMAAAFNAGSWGAIGILFGAAVGATLLLVGLELNRFVRPLHALAAVILLFILLQPSLLARPHVLAWPMVTAWTLLLLRARAGHRAPPLAAALLMLVWANVHASFAIGLVMVPFFALEALLQEEDRTGVALRWGAFWLVSLLVTLANPSGLQGLLYAFQVSSMKILPLISEWRPSSLSRDPLFFAMTALAALAIVARRPSIPLPRLLLIAALFYLAVSHARHQALFAIVSLLLVAPSLGKESARDEAPQWRAAALVAVLAVLSAIRLAVAIPHRDSPVYPGQAIASVPPALRSQPVLNAYDFGGALIFNRIAPFIDGRADMYGDAHTADAYAIERGDARRFQSAVQRWNIRWAILHPTEKLVQVLDRSPGWERVHADKYAVIYVRR